MKTSLMKMRLNFKKFSKHPPTMVGNVYLGSSSLAIVKTYLCHLVLKYCFVSSLKISFCYDSTNHTSLLVT